MSNWPGKYIIGLTGNIATGKSVARRMLEHLGAYTIDADALSHRAMSKGAPGYQPVLDKFGKWMLDKEGEIDRAKLGNVVFNDPEAMAQLEAIIHPFVNQATEMLIQRATQTVIAIEAVKLLESDLRKKCDSIWVITAGEEMQVERLTRKRNMTREQAMERIRMQSPQSEKVAAANVKIENAGSYDDLWNQISAEWKKISAAAPEAGTGDSMPAIKKAPAGEIVVQRGRPRDSKAIAEFITRLSKGRQKMTADDVMAGFGDKAYLLLKSGDGIVGLAGWQVENLVARTTDLYLESEIDLIKALEMMLTEVERASRDLQAEASLLFLMPEFADQDDTWKKLGYERRKPEALGVQAWQDAAIEGAPVNTTLYFKQLRQDRVLRPI